MTNPDFVALAKAMNVHAIRCDSLTDLPAKMKEFMDYDNTKPVLLEARVSKVSLETRLSFSRSSAFFDLFADPLADTVRIAIWKVGARISNDSSRQSASSGYSAPESEAAGGPSSIIREFGPPVSLGTDVSVICCSSRLSV